MKTFTSWLDDNLFSFLAYIVVVVLLGAVPQVRTLLWELPIQALWITPHWKEKLAAVAFVATVLFLAWFYVMAWRVVVLGPGEKPVTWRRPLQWLAALVVNLTTALGRRGRLIAALVCLTVGLGLLLGEEFAPPRWGAMRASYAVAGLAALDFGWELLMTAVWFLVTAFLTPRTGAPTPLGPLAAKFGRFFALVLTTTLFAELVWLAACYVELTGISFRIYTVWAVFQVAFLIAITAHLIDACHRASGWPIRQLSMVVVIVFVLLLLSASPIGRPPAGQQEDLATDAPPDWYEQLEARLKATDPESPAVLVAASGGGSRAALFTALTLEGLRRQPLCAEKSGEGTRAWADQIVLISSVSGGSLATAYYVNDLLRPTLHESPWPLRNSFQGVLAANVAQQAEDIKTRYYHPSWESEAQFRDGPQRTQFEKQLLPRAKAPTPAAGEGEWQWMVGSYFADDMCTDFMAPLLRGLLTPGIRPLESLSHGAYHPSIERGTSLSRFWEDRFGWGGCNNLHGYAEAGYGGGDRQPAPLVLFNTTNARRGGRMVIGYPPLPRGIFELGATEDQRPRTGLHAGATHPTQSLADFWPHYRISLADTVRASSNFPWGVHTARLRKRVLVPSSGELPRLAQEFRDAQKRLAPLFPKGSPLWLDLGKTETAEGEALPWLDAVRCDRRLPEESRKQATEFLGTLRSKGLVKEADEVLDLLDGGVNDNTGIPTLLEVLQHLDRLAQQKDADRDPMLDPVAWKNAHDRAGRILQELRRRGVILVEIDSGAKVSSKASAELLTPIQGLEAAGQSLVVTTREAYLTQLNNLLCPAPHTLVALASEKQHELQHRWEKAPAYQVVRRSPLWVRTFVCNHDRDDDVMTAWALPPSNKVKILATFFCEYRQWTELEQPDLQEQWLPSWTHYRQELKRFQDNPVAWQPLPTRDGMIPSQMAVNDMARALGQASKGRNFSQSAAKR
jgi:hypothetical protein